MARRISRALVVATVVVAALASAAPAGAVLGATPGSSGLGDPFFPLAGNGGYDVRHYLLDLEYEPATDVLEGKALITAVATQNLSRFDLDLRGFAISRLRVNGAPAAFVRDGQELIITPRRALIRGLPFVVEVRYAGIPEIVVDPDESIEGWVPTSDGAFVVGEPQGSPAWFPANDNPQDKATATISVTLPAGLTAVANGRLVSKSTRAGKTRWLWHEDRPMATYLATATNGSFRFWTDRGPKGIPIYNAVDTGFPAEDQARADAVLALQPQIIGFFAGLFGPYPFSSGGAIVDDAPEVGYALESQSKANYAAVPSEGTVVHEISHQWFGNTVTLRTWPDIWLNEGFATWSQWRWDEHVGGRQTAQERFDTLYATPATNTAFWSPAPADPGEAANIFDGTIYDRGAMTLQALRQKIGDETFTRILRSWYAEHRTGTVTTADFIALSERTSGLDLDAFFAAWLYNPAKPTVW